MALSGRTYGMSFKAVRFLAPAVARRFERKSPKRDLRHGAVSRPVGSLDRSVAWRKCTVGQRVAGGSMWRPRPVDKCPPTQIEGATAPAMLPTFGYPVTPMLAHIEARKV